MGHSDSNLLKIKEFTVANRKRFPLAGTYDMFWHYGTIFYGIREFMVVFDVLGARIAVEEITGGHLEAIIDDSLWEALALFAQSEGLTDIQCQN